MTHAILHNALRTEIGFLQERRTGQFVCIPHASEASQRRSPLPRGSAVRPEGSAARGRSADLGASHEKLCRILTELKCPDRILVQCLAGRRLAALRQAEPEILAGGRSCPSYSVVAAHQRRHEVIRLAMSPPSRRTPARDTNPPRRSRARFVGEPASFGVRATTAAP
jgi:hypothetical protein